MTRRFGTPPEAGRSYTRRPGVYAILPRRGMLLLTRQEAPAPELQLPGGGIDPGESPLTALHREVFEETGWRIAAPRRLAVLVRDLADNLESYVASTGLTINPIIPNPDQENEKTEEENLAAYIQARVDIGKLEIVGGG